MKRIALALLASSALVGCQSPGGSFGVRRPEPTPHSVVSKQSQPQNRSVAQRKAKGGDPGIMQVGYNAGWGSIQNNHTFGKVGKAIPSHGGSLPGGLQYPYQGAPPMMGGPGGGGGCASGNCAHGGPNAGGTPDMGMMPPMPGQNLMPRFTSGRTQVRFNRPTGMKIAWQASGQFTAAQLETPARYNFQQARIYRLKLTEIENRPGLELYPTLEVYPGNMKVDAYLAHNAVPIEFTDEDFDQVSGGNYVSKVIYLPDPKFQELAIAGVETLVSTRLDPGMDPVQEANRRGAILAVLRIGSVDLEMPHSPELFMNGPSAPPVPSAIPSSTSGEVIGTPIESAPVEVPAPAAVPDEEVPTLPEASDVNP